MPLSCDCYGGCWADHSVGWHEIPIPQALIDEGKEVGSSYPQTYAVARMTAGYSLVTYGGYVLVDKILRIESESEYKAILKNTESLTMKKYPRWKFDPKDDITLLELASIVKVLDLKVDDAVLSKLPSYSGRHFKDGRDG